MKQMTGKFLEAHRITIGPYASDKSYGFNGAFQIEDLRIIASDGMGWDHVSVSRQDRCPTWEEMCKVKESFFDDDECVMQLHPPKQSYVNNHSFCLHLWRPQTIAIPQPPAIMVGKKELGVLV